MWGVHHLVLPQTQETWPTKPKERTKVCVKIQISLRSKRFRRFFRPFEAFSLFGGAKIGASATRMEGAHFFSLAPIFAFKNEKCFKPAESPSETLATQAKYK